jgi:tripartite-type tricarboxylate transporter receptor subunit TctC
VTDADTAFWTVLAAVGQVSAALFAFAGLFFLGWQIRGTRKNGDLEALRVFVEHCREGERQLAQAPNPEEKNRALNELIDHFEVYAAAYNYDLVGRVSRQFIREKLRDSVATIEQTPGWQRLFEQVVTSATAGKELRKFVEKERTYIDAVISARERSNQE